MLAGATGIDRLVDNHILFCFSDCLDAFFPSYAGEDLL
jgi:hypothetical protein